MSTVEICPNIGLFRFKNIRYKYKILYIDIVLHTTEGVQSALKPICCLFQKLSGTIFQLKLNDKTNAKAGTKSGLFAELYPGEDWSSPCLVRTGLFLV